MPESRQSLPKPRPFGGRADQSRACKRPVQEPVAQLEIERMVVGHDDMRGGIRRVPEGMQRIICGYDARVQVALHLWS